MNMKVNKSQSGQHIAFDLTWPLHFWLSSRGGNPPPPRPLTCLYPHQGNLTQRSGWKREKERKNEKREEEERFVDVDRSQCVESWLTSHSNLPITTIINSMEMWRWKIWPLLVLDKSRRSRRDTTSSFGGSFHWRRTWWLFQTRTTRGHRRWNISLWERRTRHFRTRTTSTTSFWPISFVFMVFNTVTFQQKPKPIPSNPINSPYLHLISSDQLIGEY